MVPHQHTSFRPWRHQRPYSAVYAEHVKDLARRKTAADRARFETVRPSAPVASPAVDVPLDLDEDAETGTEGADQLSKTRGIQAP
jgi:hypothetical protein